MTFVPAIRKGDLVKCGETTCPAVLGTVTGAWLTLTLGLVELRDARGKPYEPPFYAEPRSVRKRGVDAIRLRRPIHPFRGRLRRAFPKATGERLANLWRGDVWIRCPRGCKAITVVSLTTRV